MINSWNMASVLLIILGGVHSILGERLIIGPILHKNVHKTFGSEFLTKRTLRLAWHMASVFMWVCAALSHFAKDWEAFAQKQLSLTFLIAFGIATLLGIIGTKGRHLSWIVFGSLTYIFTSIFISL